MKKKILLPILLIICFIPSVVLCQDLESSMTAYRVLIDKKGNEKFQKTDSAAPGETIEYRIFYKNKGKTTVEKLTVNGPVPANTYYVGGSDRGSDSYNLLVTIDNGKTWEPEPVKRMKKMSDGTKKEVIIPPDQYTHIRWITKKPLGPKEKQEFVYRVILK